MVQAGRFRLNPAEFVFLDIARVSMLFTGFKVALLFKELLVN
jgi:hypothetical protein